MRAQIKVGQQAWYLLICSNLRDTVHPVCCSTFLMISVKNNGGVRFCAENGIKSAKLASKLPGNHSHLSEV
jgi:hypothetical protein